MHATSEAAPIQLAQQTTIHVFSCEICGENHSYEDFSQHAENASYEYRSKINSFQENSSVRQGNFSYPQQQNTPQAPL
ncbi:hypothetical protein V6N11_034972 [Hibiscus sabdariffa]|uniref:Uncharacterized protein n=2 Tax=Hibiscus sabdariffa TaxID=183260 RepID=A0ABR2AT01_9ROSI